MIKFCPNCGYKLSSEGGNPPQNAVGEELGSSLDDYVGTDEQGIRIAVPKVLDNRKRLMELRNRPAPTIRPVRMDTEMDKYGSLVVGEGLVQEN